MGTCFVRLTGLLALLFGVSGVVIAAEGTPVPAPSSSAPPAPTFITVGNLFGEVIKVDATSITVRMKWYTMQMPNANNRGRLTPQQQQQQQMQRMANAKPVENHRDYTMNFTEDATARIIHLPPKLDENGKKASYSPEEFAKLKGNSATPGFKAELSELKVGQLVEAHVVRLPGSLKTKDPKDDMLVRWALIINEHAPVIPGVIKK